MIRLILATGGLALICIVIVFAVFHIAAFKEIPR